MVDGMSRIIPPLGWRFKIAAAASAAGAAKVAHHLFTTHERLRVDSGSGLLTVSDYAGRRNLCLGASTQSIARLDNAGNATLVHAEEWTQLIVAVVDAWLCARGDEFEKPRSALLLGVGGGVVARSLLALHAQDALTVHCVDSEPAVIDAAHEHFSLPDNEQCTSEVAEASAFVASSDEAFDVVIIDCFAEDGLSPSVSEGRIFRGLERLPGEMLVVVNVTWSYPDDARSAPALRIAQQLQGGAVALLEAETERNAIVLWQRGTTCAPRVDDWQGAIDKTRRRWDTMCPDVATKVSLVAGRDALEHELRVRRPPRVLWRR